MNKKILYINIDGFSYSYLTYLMQTDPEGPFAELRREGLLFSDLRSGLISITNPMQSAILCGAWSDQTHNFYQHYDWELGCVVKHRRTCDAENIGTLLAQTGKTVVSVHQFMLEGRPCQEGVQNCAYIQCPQEKSNAFQRLAVLKDLILGKPVRSGEKTFVYKEFPDFVAVYIDDIDSLGHNNAYEHYPKRALFEERQRDIAERLTQIGEELVQVLRLCKETGLYEHLTILVTTDHGMTPFWGQSSLPDLLERIRKAGIRADLPEERTRDTRVIALPYTIELSLYGPPDMTAGEKELLLQVCQDAPDVSRVFTKEEMRRDFGMDTQGPEYLLSPKYGKHFYHRNIPEDTFGAGHDSFDETSQHIFGMVLGGVIPRDRIYDDRAYVIDLLPTILKKTFDLTLNPRRNIVLEW